MSLEYYQQELARLKDLGKEFSEAHPSVAPMLSGPSADPDVERLLEGVAFLAGMLRQKINDEFPEILHGLLQLIFPHYLRPIPSTTIMAFAPKPNLKEPLTVEKGVEIASVPIEGTQCLFRTCYPVIVHPVSLTSASFEVPATGAPKVQLSFRVEGRTLEDWSTDRLRFYLAGEYSAASYLYYLLRYHITRIMVMPRGGGGPLALPPTRLVPVGFELADGLFPYPSNSFPGYRLLQEYFILPEKFLFLELQGLEQWAHRGAGNQFDVVFELDGIPKTPPTVRKDSFVLYATPAINLFNRWADPIRLDHQKHQYRVIPDARHRDHYQVYDLQRVIGIEQGSAKEKEYAPIDQFQWRKPDSPSYHVGFRKSLIGKRTEVYLSVLYPEGAAMPTAEVLSLEIGCTNATLPERLNVGDISRPTSSSPELTTFRNIRMPTATIDPPLGGALLWRLLSHLAINNLPLTRGDNLRSLLRLYIFPDSRDRSALHANRMRVDGIQSIATQPSNRIVRGHMMRGQAVTIETNGEKYPSTGDIYLLGSVLDRFLGEYATLNSFTHLTMRDVAEGTVFAWPARIGERELT